MTKCNICKFWQIVDDPKVLNGHAGQCRRYAPKSDSISAVSEEALHWARFPLTFDDDWCGEYQPDPKA